MPNEPSRDFVGFRVTRGATATETRANIKAVWGKPVADAWLLVFPIQSGALPFKLTYARARQLQDIQVAPGVWALRFE
jgi:hypothetical protein